MDGFAGWNEMKENEEGKMDVLEEEDRMQLWTDVTDEPEMGNKREITSQMDKNGPIYSFVFNPDEFYFFGAGQIKPFFFIFPHSSRNCSVLDAN